MQHRIKSTEKISFGALTKKQQDEFSDHLYDVTCDIFGGGDKEEFEEMVSKCNSEASKYLIFKNEKDEWVGYIGLHRFKKEIDKKLVVVFRVQIGLKPEYRRTNANFTFAIKEILKYKLRHPTREVYSYVAIINPSMYSIAQRYVFHLYPAPGKKVPEHIEHVIDQCADHFGFPMKEGDTFWARTIGWFPLHTKEEVEFWKTSTDERVRFYQELNPWFLEGKGLMTLIPFSLFSVLASLLMFVKYTIRKKKKFRKTQ